MSELSRSKELPVSLLADPVMIEACQVRDFGRVFRLVKARAGIYPSMIARRCDLTPSRVGEVIAGRRQLLHMDVIERISDGLRIPGHMLGLARRTWETPPSLAGTPREVPASAVEPLDAGLPGADEDARSPAADTELSARLARHAAETNVNTLVLEQFDADVDRLARDFVSRPLPLLIPEIRAAQGGVFQLLGGRQHPSQTRHLYVVAGWLSGLAAHVSLDLGDRSAAATHVRTVVQCAEISEHSPLRAWARSFQSLAAYWAGDYRRAGDLAQAGQSEGRGPGAGTIKARLLSLEARARAAEGDNRSALRILALAHEARGAAGPDELPGVFSFPEAKQWAYAGTTLLAVGGDEQIRHAISASNRAVELYQAGPEGDRSSGDLQAAHLDLATAYLAGGDVEGAGAKLSEVFGTEGYTASITIRLRNLAALLGSEPYRGAQSAVDLRAHIHEVTVRPALASNPTEPR
ncbi:XRE family transcriptional regulator [Streptomyces sp. DH18]|uniref:helix-turn-helix domain-containing protein n=1 Tax=Streptomyces sp. DH18 TaxID=3040126 RepID=UPI0024415F2D|nr:helix-turn-helix domain-containing protein [Streptomyces sp. DH18]MDG9684594.1 XRE family transcriptional regulator [Streptomyces sp. DH18]